MLPIKIHHITVGVFLLIDERLVFWLRLSLSLWLNLNNRKRNQSWVFIGRTDTETETPVLWPPHAELTHWKRPWCWEGLGAGEGDDRGWDGWMASLTQWTWVWVNSGSWWWTSRPGVLQFMGSQRIGHDWTTKLTDWLTDWRENLNLWPASEQVLLIGQVRGYYLVISGIDKTELYSHLK